MDSLRTGGCLEMNHYFAGLEKEWIEFASKTIKSKALSGEEKGCADIFLNAMEEMGVECFRDGCGNVIGIIRGQGEGPNVLLTGHMDVVPMGNKEAWGEFDPFMGTVQDGKLYGRGICDMLGGLCAEFFAFKEIKKAVDQGEVLSGDLIFCSVVQEEPAESFGTIYLFEHTFPEHDIHVDLAYLGEPSNGNLVIGQRGKVELVIDVHGKVAHSSAPEEGINAVEKAQPIIEAAFHNFYEPSITHLTGKSSMTITDVVVTPGKNYSCVPDHCEITVDRRYVLPATIEDTVAQVQNFIDALAEKDLELKAEVHPRYNHRVSYTGYENDVAKQHPCWSVDEANEYVEKSYKVLKSLGQNPDKSYWAFGTDGSVICGVYDIPTIGYSFAHTSQAHQAKEHVVIHEMLDCIEGYTAMLCEIYNIDFAKFIQ